MRRGYPRVVRRFLTPNWLGLHALAFTLVTSFLGFGWWQFQRATAGNDRSWGYTFEWPLFAFFVVFMWGKMIYDEMHPESGKAVPGKPFAAVPTAPPAASAVPADAEEVAGPVLTRDEVIARDEAADPQVAAYNRYLARLNAGDAR